jgi:Flp pilus assembly protein TadD
LFYRHSKGELNQAWDAIQARDYGLAEQHFTSVLDADPGNVRARMGLYFLYDYQRRYNDALNNLTASKTRTITTTTCIPSIFPGPSLSFR